MDSFELVRSNISMSKKSNEDCSMESIVPVQVLRFFSKELGSSCDHTRIAFLVIVLGISHYCPFFKFLSYQVDAMKRVFSKWL
jgi:hypothetical protein